MGRVSTIGFVHTVLSLPATFAALAEELVPDADVFHIADETLLGVTRREGRLTPTTRRRVLVGTGCFSTAARAAETSASRGDVSPVRKRSWSAAAACFARMGRTSSSSPCSPHSFRSTGSAFDFKKRSQMIFHSRPGWRLPKFSRIGCMRSMPRKVLLEPIHTSWTCFLFVCFARG